MDCPLTCSCHDPINVLFCVEQDAKADLAVAKTALRIANRSAKDAKDAAAAAAMKVHRASLEYRQAMLDKYGI